MKDSFILLLKNYEAQQGE